MSTFGISCFPRIFTDASSVVALRRWPKIMKVFWSEKIPTKPEGEHMFLILLGAENGALFSLNKILPMNTSI